ncbi:MAG: 50S ribosomal protein L9 [Parcubacteria group bacterium]|nr:50S ribosomal protein L9 [Parcubacteria group bacterium]
MKVVFLQDVPHIGGKWEVKDIRDGYARNFLFPRRLAIIASPEVLRDLEVNRAKGKAEKEAQAEQFIRAAAFLDGRTITLVRKAGERGTLFAGVTASDIAKALAELTGVNVLKEAVTMKEPIKTLGSHAVHVSLPGVEKQASVTITITASTDE